MNKPEVLQVALPVPLPQTFDYLPSGSGEAVAPGSRVLVGFGNRKLVGVVVGCSRESQVARDRLLPIMQSLDQGEPILDPELLELLRWCWRYYKHAPGEVVLSALPPAMRTAKGSLPSPPVCYCITREGRARLGKGSGRAPVQHAMLELLAESARSDEDMAECGASWRRTIKILLERGWARAETIKPATPRFTPGPELTPDQKAAVDSMAGSLGRFHCHLLDGVTGSGKTEVYMCLLEKVLAEGGQGLVLVPEIGLTPQLLRRFRQRLGVEPAVIHSSLAAGARLEAWSEARSGRAGLLVGTRSALFTPMPKLGVIILDEEHDASFKQQDGFRYSARDIAVKRGAELDVPVVLGSATPSLESLKNAMDGRYGWHRLRQRATNAAQPAWRVLDMKQQDTRQGLTTAAFDAVEETLQRDEQVMVFLNRRGYAPVLMCQSCGWSGSCDRCDAHLTWHRGIRLLCCHHCGSQRRVPALCPECRADALVGAGEGTQQLEEMLAKRFPDYPVLRFDRDQTRGKGVLDRQLDEVREGKPCLMVGTQMLAKGHHFPAVTLVVIVNIDQALYSADFRALERMGQMILQVAGRAGRAERPGTVILQTLHPEHKALGLLLSSGYETYARWLLEERVLAGLPPAGFQALLRAEAHDRSMAQGFLQQAFDAFPAGEAQVFGPIPAIMERVGGRSRFYLMLQAEKRSPLHAQIDAWLPRLREMKSARKVRWAIDIDPQDL